VIGETSFACVVTKGDSELPDDLDLDGEEMPIILPVAGRRAIQPGAVLQGLTPDNVTPSGLVVEEQGAAGAGSIVEGFQYGNGLEIDLDLVATERGTFLHRCFEVLGANPALMGRLLVSTGIELDEESSQSVVNSVAGFEAWLQHLSHPGEKVLGIGINWIQSGVVVLSRV